MDMRLKKFMVWLDCDSLYGGILPGSFRKSLAVIIDYFEVFIERPSNLEAHAATWYNYKHKNTLKILLGIFFSSVIALSMG